MVFLSVYRGFGGQELETTVKTKKTTKNHEKPPTPLQKPRKTKNTHSSQTVSQNPEFLLFLGFESGYGGQELEVTVKTKKTTKNHEKPPTPLQKPRKKKHSFSNYFSKSRIRSFSGSLQWIWCFVAVVGGSS